MPIQTTPHGWLLTTERTAYALGVNAAGHLVNAYWGARLPHTTDYPAPPDSTGWASFTGPAHLLPEEYAVYGGLSYVEPCLKTTFADGVRDTVLVYRDAALDGETLTVTLTDAHYPLTVRLHYRVHPAYDLIERWVSFTNTGTDAIRLERALSAGLHVPSGHAYRLTHLSGRWNDEFHLQRDRLPHGVTVLDSRRITSSHQHNPFFLLDHDATETYGDVWGGLLAWSGSWKLIAEVTDFGTTRLSWGLNDWDFTWTLDAGATFSTPAVVVGHSPDGYGGLSRRLHAYIREQVLPHGAIEHPVLYNSWEATLFDVDVESQKRLADLAAAIGVELFVMDDGWFHGRNSDRAGLGDWWPDAAKFPDGLQPLIDHVTGLGMTFGLWIEPEMVSPDSDLYRAHPDWVIHFPTRARTTARNQLILNMARTDVQDYLLAKLDALLTAHDIRFIKWDMNRNVSEPGWPDAPPDQQRELWVRYVEGVYALWGELRRRHPHVVWQSCSGGGGRVDLGILRYADQVWPSDNTEAPARLRIQDAFSHGYPAAIMEAWVTDSGAAHLPLRFKFHVSMAGALGVGVNLLKWTADDRAEAAALIAEYKRMRPLVQHGDQYRLRSPQTEAVSAVQYMARDKSTGVLLAYRTHLPNPALLPRIHPHGLDPLAHYRIDGHDATRTGAAWMTLGLTIALADFDSALLHITRVD